jgi:uncharacterized protein (TIGR02118 family)
MTVKVIAVVRGVEPDAEALESLAAGRVVVHRPYAGEPAEQPPDVRAVVAWWGDAEPDTDSLRALAPGGHVDAYRVEEHVQIDPQLEGGLHPAPGDEPPGLCRLVFVRRAPAITREQMAAHWVERHTPIVHRHHPGFWGYTQNVVESGLTPDAPEVDGVAEMRFRSVTDLRERFYDSDEGKRVVADDVVRFLDVGAGWRILSQDTWVRV